MSANCLNSATVTQWKKYCCVGQYSDMMSARAELKAGATVQSQSHCLRQANRILQ